MCVESAGGVKNPKERRPGLAKEGTENGVRARVTDSCGLLGCRCWELNIRAVWLLTTVPFPQVPYFHILLKKDLLLWVLVCMYA